MIDKSIIKVQIKSKIYLKPNNFHEEYNKSIDQGKPSDKLIKMFELIAKRYITVYRQVNKIDNDACINYAVCEAWLKWDKYNPEFSDNIFSFFTKMIKNDMAQHYNKIKKGKDRNLSIDALLSNENK